MDSELSIIIPVYNEEECITPLYEELSEVLSQLENRFEIIFVDDGSTDTSFSLLREIHKRDPSVKIIKFRRNFGQSAAMKAGFDFAEGDIIITMDGDLQNDPHDIITLIEKLKRNDLDVVCGWRRHRNDPWFKKVTSRVANFVRSSLTGESIHDSGCTLRAYIHQSVKDLELYGELHRYLPAILLWRGYRIGEMVTNHRERPLGKSKYNYKRIGKGFLDLLVVTFWHKYSARPIHIFGGAGILIGGIGLIIAVYLIFCRIFLNLGLTERPLFLVALILIILGVQFFALGIIADILLKIYYGQNSVKTFLVEQVIS